jgi:hypothetical protein
MIKNRFGSKRKRIRQPISKKIFLKVIGFFVFVAVIAIAFLFLKDNPFQIKNVHFVTSSYCAPSQDIVSIISPKKQNFFIPEFTSVEKKILDRYPCLKSASISKSFPNTLNVALSPRVKGALITTYKSNLDSQFATLEATSSSQAAKQINLVPKTSESTQSGQFIADPESFVFAESSPDPSVPNVNLFDEKVEIGQKVDGNLVGKITKISQKLPMLGMSYQAINVKDNSIFIESDPTIIMALNRDLDRQFASLQLILEKAKIDQTAIKSVDTRFDKVIVVYATRK